MSPIPRETGCFRGRFGFKEDEMLKSLALHHSKKEFTS